MLVIIILILLFPLAGFVVLGVGFRKISPRITAFIGPGTILVSFLLSVVVLISFYHFAILPSCHLFEWITIGPLRIPFEFLLDPLSCLMLLVVTGVGFVIHLYSVGYMKGDPGFNRFFAYMNLFIFSMLMLVLGGNYLVMFIGWEGVGLCSYLLIGFWYKNREYSNAAKKAFIMNRIGDLGFLLGMFLLFTTFGSLSFDRVFAGAQHLQPGDPAVVAITLLLFVGAVGKSAQIPLHTWLPDAMAGPTPVSALIHAATMVTAGVYMVARSNALYMLSPVSMAVVGLTGLVTALFAASVAIFQYDIKKVLAWSTISQLGYMFAGLGAGAFTGAMFHLTTHAFFKALLFLGAGSVIHALGGQQDIRNMGGLRNKLPKTWWTFLAGTLAIAGIPPLSGFFSKDEILHHLWEQSPALWILAVAGAMMTAFYMFRLLYLVFFRDFRGTEQQRNHLHESPRIMTIPLIILALLATVGGILNIPEIFCGRSNLGKFLAPVFPNIQHPGSSIQDPAASIPHPASHITEWALISATLAACLLMIFLAWRRYVQKGRGILPDGAAQPFAARLLSQRYFVDEFYETVIVRPLLSLSRMLHDGVEVRFIDRFVEGVGRAVTGAGNAVRYIQAGNVGFYMFMMIAGIILALVLNIFV